MEIDILIYGIAALFTLGSAGYFVFRKPSEKQLPTVDKAPSLDQQTSSL